MYANTPLPPLPPRPHSVPSPRRRRAIRYLFDSAEQLGSWGDLLQLGALDLIRKVRRIGPHRGGAGRGGSHGVGRPGPGPGWRCGIVFFSSSCCDGGALDLIRALPVSIGPQGAQGVRNSPLLFPRCGMVWWLGLWGLLFQLLWERCTSFARSGCACRGCQAEGAAARMWGGGGEDTAKRGRGGRHSRARASATGSSASASARSCEGTGLHPQSAPGGAQGVLRLLLFTP